MFEVEGLLLRAAEAAQGAPSSAERIPRFKPACRIPGESQGVDREAALGAPPGAAVTLTASDSAGVRPPV
jgi:hypothetical protein